jgi:hypothetical protein
MALAACQMRTVKMAKSRTYAIVGYCTNTMNSTIVQFEHSRMLKSVFFVLE